VKPSFGPAGHALLFSVLLLPPPLHALPLADRVDTLTVRVNRIFAEWSRAGGPGCALAVAKDGQVLYRHGYGTANLSTKTPLSTSSLFYAASVSKQFAAASILIAANQGKLSLDDDVRKWVPELPVYEKPITVRHLLHHTSGLRDYLTMWALAGTLGDVHSDADLLELLGRQQALNFDPGSEFSYSNSGYVLLSYIIERATGQSLREFARAQIFGPLGMTRTYFRDDHTAPLDAKELALGYTKTDQGVFKPGLLPNFDKVGDGGLFTTAEDLLKWDENFYTHIVGGDWLVPRQLERGILASGDTVNYAAALVVDDYKGLRTVEHEGGFMGYRTELLRFPDQHFSVAILCNLGSIDPGALARKVADLYLARDFRGRLARFVGVYASPELGASAEVLARGGDLWLRRRGAPDAILAGARRDYGAVLKDAGDRFTFDSGLGPMTAQFATDAAGRVTELRIDAGRAKNLRFVRN